MATTSELKVGVVINFNNDLHEVIAVEHRTPGNLRAFYQVKMRNLKNGKMIENRFRSGEEIQIERLEQKTYQYLYKNNSEYCFMDLETYDQIHLTEDIVGEQGHFLKEGLEVQIMFHDGNALFMEMPPHIELKVISAPPAVKGNTASNTTKPVTVETGAIINAPLFIEDNDIIKVDTRTSEYLERVKK